MGTVPFRTKPDPEVVEKTARIAITGTARGSMRRPLLYAAAGLGTILALTSPVGAIGAVVAIVALLLLAVTDVG